MKKALLPLLLVALGGPALALQTVVAPGRVAVVTSDGFFLPDPNSSTPHLVAPASDPGFVGGGPFESPAVEWEPAVTGAPPDSFLISTRKKLYRLTVLGLAPAQSYAITDLTPAGALDLFDLDVNPGSGELVLLDQAGDRALRYAPPFAQGMTPVSSLSLPGAQRALAWDSRAVPEAVIVATGSQVLSFALDGSGSQPVANVGQASGLDVDPQAILLNRYYYTLGVEDRVRSVASNPNTFVELNLSSLCTPVALGPRDVEWHTLANRAYVLAELGLNSSCTGSLAAVGGNHVVRFPSALSPVTPNLRTFAGGSGITGGQGDLAIVFPDFGTISSYGLGCSSGQAPLLDCSAGVLTPAGGSFSLSVSQAPPAAPALLALGATPQSLPLGAGCSLLAALDLLVPAGLTDGSGELSVPFALSAVTAGLSVYAQGLGFEGLALWSTQGLKFVFGP